MNNSIIILFATWKMDSTKSSNIHFLLIWVTLNLLNIPDWAIGLMSRVFTNGLGDLGSIPGQVISKTQKMVLNAALLNTQYYKVRIKGKVEQSRERSSALSNT